MKNSFPTPNPTLITAASAAMLLSGVIHLLIAPEHMGHAPAHGIFFGFSGLMQIGWGFELRGNTSRRMLLVGAALSGGLIALWALTRALGAPFIHTPEPIDWAVWVTKLADLAALAAVGGIAARKYGWRAPGEGLGLALAMGLAAYGGARLVEPFLPGLAEGPGAAAASQPGTGHTHATGQAAPINAAFSNGLLVSDAWVRPPGVPGGNATLCFSITNLSGQDDTLQSAVTPAAGRAQIAQPAALPGDITQMQLVSSLDVPRGGPLILAPGGPSILLVDLPQPLAPGQAIPVTLLFARAGRVEIKAEVVEVVGADAAAASQP